MDSTNQKGELISGSALKDKVAKIKRKRILSKLKITLIHFVFLASIVAILLFGNWLFAVAVCSGCFNYVAGTIVKLLIGT